MSDIATISLKVNIVELERGNRELDKFQTTATGAAHKADNLNSVFRAGAQATGQTSRAYSETRKISDELVKSYFKQIDGIKSLNTGMGELQAVQASFRAARAAGNITQQDYLTLISATTARQVELTRVEQVANLTRQAYIQRLKEQVDAIGKTRTELLEMRAAELGVSQQASPLIAKLREQEDAWKKGAISAGQYRMAMRQLPMQITDVVTSLASGMPVYMVAIQQGGQIRDSFGGVGNALKAVTSIITPARIAMGGLVGVAGLVAYAWYQGAREAEEFNKQLILTGNYAGKTTSQLTALARAISGNGVTQSLASSVIANVIGTGRFDTGDIEMISDVATRMAASVGVSVDETVSQFKRIADDPVKAITELDNQYHFLTSTQLEQITTLAEQGRETDAARIAIESYATAMRDRSSGIRENLGSLESAWRWVKEEASRAWDAMLNVGREVPVNSRLEDVRKKLEREQRNLSELQRSQTANAGPYGPWKSGDIERQTALVERLKKELEGLNQAAYEESAAAGREKWERQEQERQKRQFQANQDLKKQYENAEEKHQRRLQEIRNSYASDEAKKLAIDRENAQFAEQQARKGRTGSRTTSYVDDAATKMLQDSSKRLASLREQFSVTSTLTDQEKRLAEFSQQIADLKEKKILTADQKSVLARADEIRSSLQLEASESRRLKVQQETAKGHETALKYIQQQQALISSIEKSAGLSSREQQRARELEQVGMMKSSPEDKSAARIVLEERYKVEDEMRQNWLKGAQSGWAEYRDMATDTYSQISQLTKNAFTGMATTLTDFFTTGKASFKDFVATFLKGIVQMINQLMILRAIEAAGKSMSGSSIGWVSSIGDFFTGHAEGGYTGDGGKYEPKGVVHGGEFVFTKKATQALGVDTLYALMNGAQGYANGGFVGRAPMFGLTGNRSSGGNINVDMGGIVINTDNPANSVGTPHVDTGAIMRQLKPHVVDIVSRQANKPGTPLWKAIKGLA